MNDLCHTLAPPQANFAWYFLRATALTREPASTLPLCLPTVAFRSQFFSNAHNHFQRPLFVQPFLQAAGQARHQLHFEAEAPRPITANRAKDSTAVAIFVGDDTSAAVLERLAALGLFYLLVHATGYD